MKPPPENRKASQGSGSAIRARSPQPASSRGRAAEPAATRTRSPESPTGRSGAVRSWREWSGPHGALIGTGLLAGLGLLMAHAFSYRFLTDDAFISFRYARNLS